MTTEERQRMNSLCIGIQEEKNYERFSTLTRELSDLIEEKEHRFGRHPEKGAHPANRPWRTVPAVVQRIVKPLYPAQSEKVEISITEADDLFREIRIENTLAGIGGEPVALKNGAHVDVTFEAETEDTVEKTTNPGLG